MAYDKTTDLEQIQADVLGTSLANNSKVTGLNKLKTNAQVVLRAINEINSKMGNILDKANQASEVAVEAQSSAAGVKEELKTIVTEIVTQTITETVTKGGGGSIQNDEFHCEDDQVKFALTKTPVDKDNILFYVNGVKYTKADYRYNESDNSVEWLNTEADENHPNPFIIKDADIVSVVYIV